jgi:hypothetical protein
MTSKRNAFDLCVVKKGIDCLSCSFREARWGIELMDAFGGGGFNFFICEECLQHLLKKIMKRKKNT